MENRVRFKIGEIEFEAEGSSEVIERERKEFMNTLLPAAVDAIVRTRGNDQRVQYISAGNNPALLVDGTTVSTQSESITTNEASDLDRTSLASFIRDYGTLNDQDFVLIAAYYDEKKNSAAFFTSDTVKKYYADARRPEYSNRSMLLLLLAKKGYIMDKPDSDGAIPKQYILTEAGIDFVKKYEKKDEATAKKTSASKPKKVRVAQLSTYDGINLDELNLCNYPKVKSMDTLKKQMLLVMYIITNERHGELFSVADIQYLLTGIWGLPATIDQINGVFKHNKTWFKQEQDPNNKKAVRRKLLEGGKDFAKGLAENVSNN